MSDIEKKQKKSAMSKSRRMGLTLSVARVDKKLRDMRMPKRRVGGTASIYVTAAIETVLKDVVIAANNLAMAQSSKQLLSRHLQVAVHQSDVLNALLGKITIGTRETLPDPLDWILTTELQKKRKDKQKAVAVAAIAKKAARAAETPCA